MNEMRKLMEALENIDENIDAEWTARDDYMRAIRLKLFDLSNLASTCHIAMKNSPDNADQVAADICEQVEEQCDRLRKTIHEQL